MSVTINRLKYRKHCTLRPSGSRSFCQCAAFSVQRLTKGRTRRMGLPVMWRRRSASISATRDFPPLVGTQYTRFLPSSTPGVKSACACQGYNSLSPRFPPFLHQMCIQTAVGIINTPQNTHLNSDWDQVRIGQKSDSMHPAIAVTTLKGSIPSQMYR